MTRLLIRDICVTIAVPILVHLLPAIDRILCSGAGLNIQKGLSRSKDALRLKFTRYMILSAILTIYILATAWIVFFSRTAATDFRINNSLATDTINVSTYADAQQTFKTLSHVYLNIMMFVPLGYLLPYVFDFFRRNCIARSTIAGLLLSLFIENLQLVTMRGRYELDDLIANTFGALFGSLMYKCFAYVLTHPDWRKARHHRRLERKRQSHTVFGPLCRHTRVSRSVLYASDPDAIKDFYVRRLGFELQTAPDGSRLLKLGPARVEVICTENTNKLSDQKLILYAGDIDIVRERLNAYGVPIAKEYEDVFEHKACICFNGPDNVCVTMIS